MIIPKLILLIFILNYFTLVHAENDGSDCDNAPDDLKNVCYKNYAAMKKADEYKV
jgi:hypothetical protein